MKLLIVYYSMTGTNYKMANWAKEGAEEIGAEVRLVKAPEIVPAEVMNTVPHWKAHVDATKDIPNATLEDLDWADAIIFSSPSRFGGVASQLKQFIDSASSLWMEGKTVNKVVSAMSSAMNLHGGQEVTILDIYKSMFHWSAIVVAPGYSDPITFAAGGNPYGTSVTVSQEGKFTEDEESVIKAIKHQVKRVVEMTKKIKA